VFVYKLAVIVTTDLDCSLSLVTYVCLQYVVCSITKIQGGPKKNCTIFKYFTPIRVDTEKHSICQNVQFFIWNKTDVFVVTAFKYSLHNFNVNTMLK